jgi:hypothetical protein
MAKKTTQTGLLDWLFVGSLVVVFVGVMFHAPLSVGLSTLWPNAEPLIKAWKEIIIVLSGLLAIVALTRRKQWGLLRSPIPLLILMYGLLHLVLIPVSGDNPASIAAGLIIDLRYVLFFALVYIAVSLYPDWRRRFVIAGIAGATAVVGFAALQATVLPRDILSHIGYNATTIQPYLTVDENPDFVRINSTLRGPNPLGAFAVMTLTLLVAFWLKGRKKLQRPAVLVAVIGIGSLIALWASYSRSAVIAAMVAVGLLVLWAQWRRISKRIVVIIAATIVVFAGGLFLARDTSFVSNVILHENATTGADVNSNEGHIESLNNGVARMLRQPLGGGIGSTGSASLYSDEPLIIENQYLFIAHETGWIGLVVFLMIFWRILQGLWARRSDWLAAGVLASGIGLALIGLLLPVWADDTIGIVWWGLAGIALGGIYGTVHKTTKRTA